MEAATARQVSRRNGRVTRLKRHDRMSEQNDRAEQKMETTKLEHEAIAKKPFDVCNMRSCRCFNCRLTGHYAKHCNYTRDQSCVDIGSVSKGGLCDRESLC